MKVAYHLLIFLLALSSSLCFAADPNKKLERAVARCNSIEIKNWLEKGANPSIVVNGKPAVIKCFDSYDAVETLIKHGADVNAKYGDNNEPVLSTAGRNSTYVVVKMMVDAGADVNQVDKYNRDALYNIARHEKGYNSLKLLLQKGALANRMTNTGKTALMEAAGDGNVANSELLIQHGANVNSLNDKNQSALFYAVSREHVAVVQVLLKNGANPNISSKTTLTTPLMTAVSTGNSYLVEELLKYKADKTAKDNLGGTALTRAQLAKKYHILDLLQKD